MTILKKNRIKMWKNHTRQIRNAARQSTRRALSELGITVRNQQDVYELARIQQHAVNTTSSDLERLLREESFSPICDVVSNSDTLLPHAQRLNDQLKHARAFARYIKRVNRVSSRIIAAYRHGVDIMTSQEWMYATAPTNTSSNHAYVIPLGTLRKRKLLNVPHHEYLKALALLLLFNERMIRHRST